MAGMRSGKRLTMAVGALGAAAAAWACLFVSGDAWATNGQEPIGWGQRAVARGGADVAVGGGPISMNLNPATLAQLARKEFEIGPQLLLPDQHFENGPDGAFPSPPFNNAGNDKDSHFNHTILPNAAFAMPLTKRLVLGVGMFAQAGLGADYELNHRMWPGRTMDDETDFSLAKTSLGLGYKLTDTILIGAAANVGYNELDLRSVNGPAWLNIKEADGFSYGFTLGALWQATDKLRIGVSYASPLYNRHLEANLGDVWFTSLPIPGVPAGAAFKYKKVYIDEFKFPQKISVGALYEFTKAWRVMGEVRWVDNDNSAFGHMRAEFRKGMGPAPDMDVWVNLKQKEQFIYILGTEYDVTKWLTVACGYNYGDNPVSGKYLNPAAPAIVKHHLSLGVRVHGDWWYVGVAYVHGFSCTLRSDNSAIDGGVDYSRARLSHDQDSIVLGAGIKF